MTFQFDTLHITHQLTTGIGYPDFLGYNKDVIRGSVYLDGPAVIGDETSFEYVEGSVMIGPCNNEDSPIPQICNPKFKFEREWSINPCNIGGIGAEKYGRKLAHPYSLVVKSGTHKVRDVTCEKVGYKEYSLTEVESDGAAFFDGDVDIYGYTRIKDRLSVSQKADFGSDVVIKSNLITGGSVTLGGSLNAAGEVTSQCGTHVLSVKKDFDIPHPTREGWRLTHACVEGPEAAVYVRGRVKNQTEIHLPEYWTKLVDESSITVSLTPIGSHQDVIVKRIGDNKVYLQSKGGMPIDCFYHIFGERLDTEKLIPEYKGTIEDYPGDNSQRSIVGYHYDTK